MSKSKVKEWVMQMCELVLDVKECPRLVFITAVPVEGPEKEKIKRFNCNLITAVQKCQKQYRPVVVIPVHMSRLRAVGR